MLQKILNTAKYLLFSFFVFWGSSSFAQIIIRDAETEHLLSEQLRILFKAAGLPPENAQIVLISDDSVNAFVAGGQTVFIHTGLITNAKTLDDVAFVLAHETGHIVAGHVIQGVLEQKKLQTASLISGLIGSTAGILAGRPDASIAVLMGSSGSGAGLFASYRQTQESTADRIAIDILKKTGHSSLGFKNIMTVLKNDERLNGGYIPPYLQTHPFTQTRLNDLSRFWNKADLPKPNDSFNKVRAKLIGFLNSSEKIKQLYTKEDTPSLYARSIDLFRSHKISEAINMLDVLIKREKNNPWFHELKAQFLFESGQINLSIQSYQKALSLAPNEPLIRLATARALIESENKANLITAEQHIDTVLHHDSENADAWLMKATIHDRQRQQTLSQYAMARFYASTGDLETAKKWAKKTLKNDFKDRYPTQTHHLNDILQAPEK